MKIQSLSTHTQADGMSGEVLKTFLELHSIAVFSETTEADGDLF